MTAVADALMMTVQRHRQAVRAGLHDYACILNVAVFAIIWNADLSVLLEDLRVLDGIRGEAAGWRRKLTARLLALTIVEAGEEFSGLLGRDFRTTVKRLSDDATVKDLNGIHKALSRLRDAHDARLRVVRNTVVAHRARDAAAQVESLRSLNVKDVEHLGWELLKWTTSLHNFVSAVIADSRSSAA